MYLQETMMYVRVTLRAQHINASDYNSGKKSMHIEK